jgi:hypothetical protein
MKLKYLIKRGNSSEQIVVQEFGELDRDTMDFMCEVIYAQSELQAAMQKGREALIAVLRTRDLYPPAGCAQKLAEAVFEYCKSNSQGPLELLFDEKEAFAEEVAVVEEDGADEEAATADDDADTAQLDEMIDDSTDVESGKKTLRVDDIEESEEDED